MTSYELDHELEGRPIVVDLWNAWCGPCIDAMKEFEEKKQSYADSDVVLLKVYRI